jgi:hypothetical protein
VLPARLRHRIDALTVTALPADARAAVDPEVLVAVGGAVRAEEVLRFDYLPGGEAAGAEPTRRRAEPHHVVVSGGRWYLVAWDLDRAGWRVFRLDRLRPRFPTGPRFTPRAVPGGDVHQFLAARFRGSRHANAWPCTGTVVVHRPAREVAPFVADGTVEAIDADRCRVVAGSWSWVALAAALGRFDAAVTDVSPRELADAFALLARRFAQAAGAATAGGAR